MEKTVTVDYFLRNISIKIEAVMRKSTFAETWSCDLVKKIAYGDLIFDLDKMPPNAIFCIEKYCLGGEDAHALVEEICDMGEETEWTGPVTIREQLADVGMSQADFLWSSWGQK